MSDYRPDLYDEMRTLREPWVGRNSRFGLATTSWAQSVVKSCFTLNGGGLVALPALAGLTKAVVSDNVHNLAVAIYCYAYGLFAAALAGIFGYFSAARGEQVTLGVVEMIENTVRIGHGIGDIEKQKARNDALQAIFVKGELKYKATRYFGIILALSSVAAFAWGTRSAYPILSSGHDARAKTDIEQTSIPAQPPAIGEGWVLP